MDASYCVAHRGGPEVEPTGGGQHLHGSTRLVDARVDAVQPHCRPPAQRFGSKSGSDAIATTSPDPHRSGAGRAFGMISWAILAHCAGPRAARAHAGVERVSSTASSPLMAGYRGSSSMISVPAGPFLSTSTRPTTSLASCPSVRRRGLLVDPGAGSQRRSRPLFSVGSRLVRSESGVFLLQPRTEDRARLDISKHSVTCCASSWKSMTFAGFASSIAP